MRWWMLRWVGDKKRQGGGEGKGVVEACRWDIRKLVARNRRKDVFMTVYVYGPYVTMWCLVTIARKLGVYIDWVGFIRV